MDIENQSEQDREQSAYHEVGHAVVGENLGFNIGKICLRPTNTSKPMEESLWTGKCEYVADMPPEDHSIFAAAGFVAEAINGNEWADYSESLKWEDYKELHLRLSPSDEAAIDEGENPNESFRKAHTILLKKWPVVEKVVEALLEHQELTKSEFEEIFYSSNGKRD